MITLYGIPNCDTVKRARKALDLAQVPHKFHDLRSDGLSIEQVQSWLDELGTKQLVNRNSTSWRQLSEDEKQAAEQGQAAALLLRHPTLIKRPLISRHGALKVGFAKKDQDSILAWLQSSSN